jgi:hypothetical protein
MDTQEYDGTAASFYTNEDLEADILRIINAHPDIYDSRSHLIRIAIIRELNRVMENIENDKPNTNKNRDD